MEALIDLRIASDPAVSPERLATLRERLAAEYPKVDEKREYRAEFRVEAGKVVQPVTTDLGVAGLFLRSRDGTRIAQFRRDGFTLNQLKPDVSADVLIPEAIRLWELYAQIVHPVAVTRVAMRYINALSLPYREGDDFNRFLTAAPEMPAGAPQTVSSFLTRMVAHEGHDVAITTQKLEHGSPDKPTGVTLDIDVFASRSAEPDSRQLMETLQRLRVLKNRIFFALLTDEALQLYT